MVVTDETTLTIILVGGNEIKQGLPIEEAQRIQQQLMLAFEKPEVTGSMTLPNGALIRYAAVAASRFVVRGEGGPRATVLR